MAFEYVSVEEAMARPGLRMVVVGGVPSPWGEAAKGLLHMKGIDWTAVRLDYASDAMKAWTGQRGGPVAMHDDEPPRGGWREILLLAERLAPSPALLPEEAEAREAVLALGHGLLGEGGLAWTRRLQLVEAGLQGTGGFPGRVAGYLAKKYGHSAEAGAVAGEHVATMLRGLAERLEAQRRAGSEYLVGTGPTAADVYLAACMALFEPLPQDRCAMDAATRAAFETRDPLTAAALDAALLAHRDRMYQRHLALPLAL